MRIRNKDTLTSHGNISGRKIVAELLDAGLDSLDPYYRVKEFIKVENGKIIINANNYNWNALPTVAVEINGQRISEFTELRSEEKKNGTITIEPYEPVMLMCE